MFSNVIANNNRKKKCLVHVHSNKKYWIIGSFYFIPNSILVFKVTNVHKWMIFFVDERSIVTSSDMEGSIVGAHGGAGNVYEVEHLATFQLSKDLAFPADGMRRLLHMEKNGFGIWSQKMKIRLEHRDIVILDYENGVSKYTTHLNILTFFFSLWGFSYLACVHNALWVWESNSANNLDASAMFSTISTKKCEHNFYFFTHTCKMSIKFDISAAVIIYSSS